MNRRNFIQTSTLAGAATLLPYEMEAANSALKEPESGDRRLKLLKLQKWKSVKPQINIVLIIGLLTLIASFCITSYGSYIGELLINNSH